MFQKKSTNESSLEVASRKIDEILTAHRDKHRQNQSRIKNAVANLDEIYEGIRRDFEKNKHMPVTVDKPQPQASTVREPYQHSLRQAKSDFTAKWLDNDLKSWTKTNPKPDLLNFDSGDQPKIDDGDVSIGSGSAEILEICGNQPAGSRSPSPSRHVPDLVPTKKKKHVVKPSPIRYTHKQAQNPIPASTTTSHDPIASARKTVGKFLESTINNKFYGDAQGSNDVCGTFPTGEKEEVPLLMPPVFAKAKTPNLDSGSLCSDRSARAYLVHNRTDYAGDSAPERSRSKNSYGTDEAALSNSYHKSNQRQQQRQPGPLSHSMNDTYFNDQMAAAGKTPGFHHDVDNLLVELELNTDRPDVKRFSFPTNLDAAFEPNRRVSTNLNFSRYSPDQQGRARSPNLFETINDERIGDSKVSALKQRFESNYDQVIKMPTTRSILPKARSDHAQNVSLSSSKQQRFPREESANYRFVYTYVNVD